MESHDFKLMKYSVLLVHYFTTGLQSDMSEATGNKRLVSLVNEKRKLYTLLMNCSEMCRPNLFGTLHDENENNYEAGNEARDEAAASFQIISWIVERMINKGLVREAIGPDLKFHTQENIVFLSHWLHYVSGDHANETENIPWQENRLSFDAARLLESLLSHKTSIDIDCLDNEETQFNLGAVLILKLLGVYTSISEYHAYTGIFLYPFYKNLNHCSIVIGYSQYCIITSSLKIILSI
eukprot:CAMPEP_0204876330 /NCGR_PEP_ID=MMETSP1348-20121228/47578_1 /ASSEMBLY_ACC=CAM_ASM_000700 /TAXON_ID=215587 /ORGANISM="Aplanochytrium stocchinoi, Strain GSBS06" /LENGTH=237 /DNA_ID=CAMNT_0052033075 /DNA_START=351 /DNA_END=1064 /DNA_ORIENTATION=-